MRMTDGQTDGQNYDSQDRASIAASCSKNWRILLQQFYCPYALSTFKLGIRRSHIGKPKKWKLIFYTMYWYHTSAAV